MVLQPSVGSTFNVQRSTFDQFVGKDNQNQNVQTDHAFSQRKLHPSEGLCRYI